MVVVVVQVVVAQYVDAIIPVGETSLFAKFTPARLMYEPPDFAAFSAPCRKETTGASNEKKDTDVPVILATAMRIKEFPEPDGAGPQLTVEVDVHAVVEHSPSPNIAVGVTPKFDPATGLPKLRPVMVTDTPPDAAVLLRNVPESTGASQVKLPRAALVPTEAETVSAIGLFVADPE
jgi:hypothetical protein